MIQIVSEVKSHSTKRAAQMAGVSYVTLRRWLADGRFEPSIVVPMENRHLYRFTESDIKRLRRYKEAHYWEGRGGHKG